MRDEDWLRVHENETDPEIEAKIVEILQKFRDRRSEQRRRSAKLDALEHGSDVQIETYKE